jgi:uncharacterized membrane-anchored protein
MQWFPPVLFVSSFMTLLCATGAAQTSDNSTNDQRKIQWQVGPVTARLGSQAKIDIPKGYLFADPAEARKVLEMTENIPTGNELGIIAPIKGGWFVIFEFNDAGYIKDDEKKSLDADKILETMKKGTEAANEERKRRGWSTMSISGWVQKPHYDETTHNLEWSIEGVDEKGSSSVNHSTRYLGRRGYMSVELVVNPKEVATTMPLFRTVLTGFSYTPENDYRAFIKGDKVAEYGLSALVLGGAAGIMAKTGFFKVIWKFLLVGWKLIVAGLAGLGALLKKLFSGSSTKNQAAQSEDGQ